MCFLVCFQECFQERYWQRPEKHIQGIVMPSSPFTAAPLVFPLADESATMALGTQLAGALRLQLRNAADLSDGLSVHCSGDLGAGKTTLVRALLRALGVTGRIKSPTFTLVEPYEISLDDEPNGNTRDRGDGESVELKRNLSLYCYHFDFYRFTHPREFLEAGFREYFGNGALCLVEWPERVSEGLPVGAAPLLPPADLFIRLETAGEGRRASIEAYTDAGRACLSLLTASGASAASS
jgi:tRNA threonylcarbamoyladenosine biosynthesis protein TsaE